MPPRTDDELIELKLPWRGMNSDISAPQLSDDMCSSLYNYVPGEPGQMRLRNGLDKVAHFAKAELTGSARGRYTCGAASATEDYASNQSGLNSITTAMPVGVAVYGTRALITYACWTDGTNQGLHGHWYYGGRHTGSGNGGAQFRTMVYDSVAGTIVEPHGDGTDVGGTKRWQKIWNDGLTAALVIANPTVFGHGVAFDERVFFVPPIVRGQAKFMPIQSWAGAGAGLLDGTNPPAVLDVGNLVSMQINNGSRVYTSNESTNENTVLKQMGLLLKPETDNLTDLALTSEGSYVYKFTVDNPTIDATTYLTQEYGRGAVVGVVPNETTVVDDNFKAAAVMPVARGPWGVLSLNEFQGRLFAFSGSFATYAGSTGAGSDKHRVFPNIVQWSTGIAEEWLPENFFFIDDASNDVVVGGGTLGDTQLIFTHGTTYIMSGYDEDSFQLDVLSRATGCVDPRSIRNIDGRLYWFGDEGLWSWSGRGLPVRESHPRSGVGIRSELLAGPLGSVTPDKRTHNVGNVKDRVVFSVQPSLGGANMSPLWSYHPSTGAFGKWGLEAQTFTYTLTSTNCHKLPWMFFDMDGSEYAVGGTSIWKMDRVFDEVTPSSGDATSTILSRDEYRDTSDADALEQIGARIRFRDLQVRPGRTVRVKSTYVEHACLHTDTTKDAVQLKLGVDHDMATSLGVLGTAKARVETNAAGAFDQGRYFTDRFHVETVSVALEGTTLRFQIDKDATSTYQNDGGHKLYRVYAMIQVTRNSRVDTTGA